jgi:uncharacterized protein YciI
MNQSSTLYARRFGDAHHRPTDLEEVIVEEHSDYLFSLAEKGLIILYGRTQNNDESTFGIVVFLAESEQAARQIMEDDPAVAHGVMRGRLFPYRVADLGKLPGGSDE